MIRPAHHGDRRSTAACAAVAALVLLSLCGCGYRQAGLFRTDVRTVAVPIFENRTFYQGIEFALTEAVIKEIELRTPYKVTAASTADTILAGKIELVNQRRLSRTRDGGLVQDVEMTLIANAEWKFSGGKTLRRREGMQTAGRAVVTRPVGEQLELGLNDAVQAMATKIVDMMREDW